MNLKELVNKVKNYYDRWEYIFYLKRIDNSNFYKINLNPNVKDYLSIIEWLEAIIEKNEDEILIYEVEEFNVGSAPFLKLVFNNFYVDFVYPRVEVYRYIIRSYPTHKSPQRDFDIIKNAYKEPFEQNEIYLLRYSLVGGGEIITEIYPAKPSDIENPSAIINAFVNAYVIPYGSRVIEYECDLVFPAPKCYFVLFYNDGEAIKYDFGIDIREDGSFSFIPKEENLMYIK